MTTTQTGTATTKGMKTTTTKTTQAGTTTTTTTTWTDNHRDEGGTRAAREEQAQEMETAPYNEEQGPDDNWRPLIPSTTTPQK